MNNPVFSICSLNDGILHLNFIPRRGSPSRRPIALYVKLGKKKEAAAFFKKLRVMKEWLTLR
jgi:hypothetical protein